MTGDADPFSKILTYRIEQMLSSCSVISYRYKLNEVFKLVGLSLVKHGLNAKKSRLKLYLRRLLKYLKIDERRNLLLHQFLISHAII